MGALDMMGPPEEDDIPTLRVPELRNQDAVLMAMLQQQPRAPEPVRPERTGALQSLMQQAKDATKNYRTPDSGLEFAAAMLAPTKTGHFSESLSNGLGVMGAREREDAKLRGQYEQLIFKAMQPQTVGKSLIDPMSGSVISTDRAWIQEQEQKRAENQQALALRLLESRQARGEKLDAAEQARLQRASEAKLAREDRASQAARDITARGELALQLKQMGIDAAAANRQEPAPVVTTIADPEDPKKSVVVNVRTGARIGAAPDKPKPELPTAAIKEQLEATDLIGQLSGLNQDLGEFRTKITEGKLPLGFFSNNTARVRNLIGMSSPESAEFASFKASMEKMRNTSLLLNKGIQTEGDAVRAWNELFENLNDKDVVAKRLEEIQNINERAMRLKALSVDALRANFGAPPMDFTPYMAKKPAIVESKKGTTREASGPVRDNTTDARPPLTEEQMVQQLGNIQAMEAPNKAQALADLRKWAEASGLKWPIQDRKPYGPDAFQVVR